MTLRMTRPACAVARHGGRARRIRGCCCYVAGLCGGPWRKRSALLWPAAQTNRPPHRACQSWCRPAASDAPRPDIAADSWQDGWTPASRRQRYVLLQAASRAVLRTGWRTSATGSKPGSRHSAEGASLADEVEDVWHALTAARTPTYLPGSEATGADRDLIPAAFPRSPR